MFKILKQELLFFPLMMLLIEVFRNYIKINYPDTALFDRGSEFETFIFRLWQITWITSACWLLVRVVFPKAFRSLVRFYTNFDDFKEEYKQGFSLKLFLTFFLAFVLLLSGRAAPPESFMRAKLLDTLEKQLHVRELTGNNDGLEVERYLKFVGRFKGDAWCAAYCSYNLNSVGVTKPINPTSAWAPVFANEKFVTWSQARVKSHQPVSYKPGDCFTLYYPAQGRVGHVGFIIGETGNYFITNEGNTGLSGTREGSGVHKLKRSKAKVYAISNYITPYINYHEKTFNSSGGSTCHTVQVAKSDNKHYRKNGRENRSYHNSKGLYGLQGLAYNRERIDSNNTGRCEGRQYWQGKYAGSCKRNGEAEGYSFHYRRAPEGELCLQGSGNESTLLRALDKESTVTKAIKTRGKDREPGKGSTIYPEMGRTVGMGRSTLPAWLAVGAIS